MAFLPLGSVRFKVLFVFTCLILLASGLASTEPSVRLEWDRTGLSSLRYANVNYLAFGDFRLLQANFENPDGSLFPGDVHATTSVDARGRTITQKFPWGFITAQYVPSRDRLNVRVTVHNQSRLVLQGVWFQPLGLAFPASVREYDGNIPLLANSYGQPAIVRLSYPTGALALASDDGTRAIQLGFPWATDRPKSTIFPVSVNTGKVNSFPDSSPNIKRPIEPGKSDSYVFSLRFGPEGATTEVLAGDVNRRFATDFPPALGWQDHRPIGALFLSTSAAGWPRNPRGWLQDPKVETDNPAGIAELKRRVLAYADTSIEILHKMNAQGMITWDIEGQEFPHAASYICDPRVFDTLAPEMADIADEYFKKFRDAGLRVGVCLRPQRLTIADNRSHVTQNPVDDPTDLLIEKALWAKKRWGATLFYVDSNVNADDLNPIATATFQKLLAAVPDGLFIPEHSRAGYYAYTAPYRELRQGRASTDAQVRTIYPGAFSVVYTADGPIDKRHDDLVQAVKHGDILMFRAWFEEDQSTKDLQIYREATQPPAEKGKSTPNRASIHPQIDQ